LLKKVVANLKEGTTRVSVFIDPFVCSLDDLASLKDIGVDRVELYTEAFATSFEKKKYEDTLARYQKVALEAKSVGLDINAGHDLNLKNLNVFKKTIPFLKEVSIGHALISDALYFGLEKTIELYLKELEL